MTVTVIQSRPQSATPGLRPGLRPWGVASTRRANFKKGFVHIRILLSDTYSYDQFDKMATQSQGIKRLMAAEKEAAQVVANARKSE